MHYGRCCSHHCRPSWVKQLHPSVARSERTFNEARLVPSQAQVQVVWAGRNSAQGRARNMKAHSGSATTCNVIYRGRYRAG
jgi:hypothetical protein